MTVEQVAQYGPAAAAYASGVVSAWGFIMKVLLPKELKVLTTKIEHLETTIAEMKPEVDEYRQLKARALKEKLNRLPSPNAMQDSGEE